MNVLIAPNAFKGTLSASEAGSIIEQEILKKYPKANTTIHPIADGGDGTCQLLSQYLQLPTYSFWTLDALGRPVFSSFGFDQKTKTAYLDVSSASGLGSLRDYEQDPWITSSYGTGLMVGKATDLGAEEIVLGLGGSATIDLGIGILHALGCIFLDHNGRELVPFSKQFPSKASFIQLSPTKPKIKFTCLCDVNNSFFGSEGAIPVFGLQKGLKEEEFEAFETHCQKSIELIGKKAGKEFKDQEGFGAAGGIALGLSFFFPVQIHFGSAYFFELTQLEKAIQQADLIITGEGKFDTQSSGGKACYELLKLAKTHGKKTCLISSGKEALDGGFDQVIILPDLDFSQPEIKKIARKKLIQALENQLII
ncbi:glycerate kinase family protein [Algoriphagus hitonicola]|uniref:Glycerate kinase n=1 Tax=Algoriphagus hitonicola TaxID=435880 RepID=A0A1I2R3N7_9BACT|nr:glycerate kinase [Algoriphagus hitonicola]SFG35020.1 glycerate kinase [Algoriphagus hitonicola]